MYITGGPKSSIYNLVWEHQKCYRTRKIKYDQSMWLKPTSPCTATV